ncbi:MAG TPA: alpha/beta hydrolase [Longimicrobium sp.]|nr:alpha/beta hydrolase [Longimicrobium sp.]
MTTNPRAPDRPVTVAEQLQRIIARALSGLPGPLLVRLSGRPPVVIDGQTLDPHVQLVLAMRKKRGVPGLVEPNPQVGRARFRRECLAMGRPSTEVGNVRDLEIPGPAGPLRVRHYAPDAQGPQPLTVYLHGGGFVIGDLDTHDEACRILCREGRMHILAVDYRLAPEHPFPAAPDDTHAALRWAQAHAAELGADPARVAIGGDSAGGNLAAVVAREAARDGSPPVAQLLIYPATDSETVRPSEEKFSDGYFLSTADRQGFSKCYTGGTGYTGLDPRVSPLRSDDMGGLPPALVVTAGFDILRDEGDAYAEALKAAGTRTEHLRIPSLGHGFLHMTTITPAARAAMVRIARDWRGVLDEVVARG